MIITPMRSLLITIMSLLLFACDNQTETLSESTAEIPTTTTSIENQDAANMSAADPVLLTNSQWQLVQIRSMDDSTYTPDDPGKYLLTFLPEGQLGVKADCNVGGGRWTLARKSQIQFTQMITTLAMCPEGSLNPRFMKDLNFVRSFVFRDGHLFLATMADGSILEFEPVADSNSASISDKGLSQNQPAFDCSKTEGEIETLICNTPSLAKLDLHIDQLYQAALATFPEEETNTLKAIQRGWIKGRDDCWKEDRAQACVEDSYARRMTELQIRTGHFMAPERVVYHCKNDEQLVVYFYKDTKIPAAVVNTATEQFLTYKTSATNGAKYLGRNETLWNHEQELQWDNMDQSTNCAIQ